MKLMRKITIDPTDQENTVLQLANRCKKFPHTKKDAGAGLIRAIKKLNISSGDALHVITGPGNFTACRIAALAANTVSFLTDCKLFSRNTNEKKFKLVKQVLPFYSSAPNITTPKK